MTMDASCLSILYLSSSGQSPYVLIKLADHADDEGYCYPSVSRIAHDCELDVRTVQRSIAALEQNGLLRIERRYRNGSASSNAYYLKIPMLVRDTIPPPSRHIATTPLELCRVPGGSAPCRTTIEPSSKTTTTNHHAGDLVGAGRVGLFTGIPRAIRDEARQRLSGLPSDLAQLVADEWTAHLRLGTIRKPTAYLITLIRLASTGQFVPKLADRERQRRLADQERLSHHHAKPTPI